MEKPTPVIVQENSGIHLLLPRPTKAERSLGERRWIAWAKNLRDEPGPQANRAFVAGRRPQSGGLSQTVTNSGQLCSAPLQKLLRSKFKFCLIPCPAALLDAVLDAHGGSTHY